MFVKLEWAMSSESIPNKTPALSGEDLRRAIREVLAELLDLNQYEVFIFGSEAGASGPSRSDVDIGIRGPAAVPGATMERIRAGLENLRTLRVFDVVDFSRVDDSFKSVALHNVERL